ncbi:hypothetical protein MAPG_03036 [Magnaporthiopsis poae ATCC 64411]|uniref:Uncharacterized protein n=1 Tax=Magnaporthiopsis poae (strain ATCC 64411 / 73-15) TaxID=644358 RepID=A0A0C4DSY9_MAGP6|nr:hypothetical protein MAPG_03036 [Magnaporthiopsis poae ATCC 64411]
MTCHNRRTGRDTMVPTPAASTVSVEPEARALPPRAPSLTPFAGHEEDQLDWVEEYDTERNTAKGQETENERSEVDLSRRQANAFFDSKHQGVKWFDHAATNHPHKRRSGCPPCFHAGGFDTTPAAAYKDDDTISTDRMMPAPRLPNGQPAPPFGLACIYPAVLAKHQHTTPATARRIHSAGVGCLAMHRPSAPITGASAYLLHDIPTSQADALTNERDAGRTD